MNQISRRHTKNILSFQEGDVSLTSFQYLEDLACAYWYSEVLFTALSLELFSLINEGYDDVERLAEKSQCKPEELGRFLKALKVLSLVGADGPLLYLNPLAQRYLVKSSPEYMGDFLLYRRYMKPSWGWIESKISLKKSTDNIDKYDDDYGERTRRYVQAMDSLMMRKAEEICTLTEKLEWSFPVLDIGGGAGSLLRAITSSKRLKEEEIDVKVKGVLYEIPEVVKAVKDLYSNNLFWDHIEIREGDFRASKPENCERFGLIILSNFLHAYSAEEAEALLVKACRMLKDDGFLLIHDYFPDRIGVSPHKSALYDLNMMLNTYNGVCHEARTIAGWLEKAGFSWIETCDLSTDTSVIFGRVRVLDKGEKAGLLSLEGSLKRWEYHALEEGFEKAVLIPAKDVFVAPWVALKCRYGCPRYGKNLRCPPHSLPPDETARIIDSYRWAVFLEGVPPGKEFHTRLLSLEKRAFLEGYHKALVFGAGPCEICEACPDDGRCRHREMVRPSMEGAGIDVFGTASKAGIVLKVLGDRNVYVKYLGLLLLE